MKKISILILSAMLFAVTSIYAQDTLDVDEAPPVQEAQPAPKEKKQQRLGGIRGGFHSAYLVEDGSKPDTANSLNSFYVGFYKDKQLASLLYLGSGLEYFQNGLAYSEDSKRVFHTISVPVSLKVQLGPVFAQGGVAANFKISEKIVVGDSSGDVPEGQKSEWFDVPAFVGAGVDIWFLTFEARYHWGLLDVWDGKYNRYFQIGAGISF